VAQLVEHHLAKVGVAGSNPVVRSRSEAVSERESFPAGDTAGDTSKSEQNPDVVGEAQSTLGRMVERDPYEPVRLSPVFHIPAS
jgi:hypothetical protein